MSWLALTLRLAAAISLPWLATARPDPSTSDSSSFYSITGTWAITNKTQLASTINGQPLLPYNGTFWFGLPKGYWCKAPQPGKGTNFTCTGNSYQPLYTLDQVLALATSNVNPSIAVTPGGVVTYASASAEASWTITNYPSDPTYLLAYQNDAIFSACPEQLDDASTAYQVMFDSVDPVVVNKCPQISLQVDMQAVPVLKSLPYGYV